MVSLRPDVRSLFAHYHRGGHNSTPEPMGRPFPSMGWSPTDRMDASTSDALSIHDRNQSIRLCICDRLSFRPVFPVSFCSVLSELRICSLAADLLHYIHHREHLLYDLGILSCDHSNKTKNANEPVDLIPVPSGLSAYLLLIPLRGQEECRKQAGIGHWGRSAQNI